MIKTQKVETENGVEDVEGVKNEDEKADNENERERNRDDLEEGKETPTLSVFP